MSGVGACISLVPALGRHPAWCTGEEFGQWVLIGHATDATFIQFGYCVVVVEILFCIADQTGNGAQYYDGDKVTAESQGYN